MGWTFAFLFILLAGAVAITQILTRSVPRRRELKQQLAATEERPPIDIHALVREEVADLGIERVPGSDGVDLAVLLRVWRRDEAIHQQCTEGIVHYQVRPGTEPGAAHDDDVRMVCADIDDELPAWQEPISVVEGSDAAGPADLGTDGTAGEPDAGEPESPPAP